MLNKMVRIGFKYGVYSVCLLSIFGSLAHATKDKAESIDPGASCPIEQQLVHITSDVLTDRKDMKLCIAEDGTIISGRVYINEQLKKEFLPEDLEIGIVLVRMKMHDVIKMKGHFMRETGQWVFQVDYLISGLSGDWGHFFIELAREEGQWNCYLNSYDGRRRINSLFAVGTRLSNPWRTVVGIEKFTASHDSLQ